MPYKDELHKSIVLGGLEVVQSIADDVRLRNVHISIDIAASNEFGSYVTIKFAKPNSADPNSWALVDFKENDEDDKQPISTMIMLRRKGDASGESRVIKLNDMPSAKQHFEQVLDYLAK